MLFKLSLRQMLQLGSVAADFTTRTRRSTDWSQARLIAAKQLLPTSVFSDESNGVYEEVAVSSKSKK